MLISFLAGFLVAAYAAPALADPAIAAAGDMACDPADAHYNSGQGDTDHCRMSATSDLLLAGGFDAVLLLGDNQYEDGALAKYQQSYDPTWGRVKAITRPAPGNHDYGTAAAAGYFSYFGAAAGDPAKGYYSSDLGAWHLVALNSNCAAVGGCGAGSPQDRWLQADLDAHLGSCILAFWHHPRFSSGSHGSDDQLDGFWRSLYRYGADVVLNGHEHVYERFHRQTPAGAADVNGIREFVVGTGGKSQTAFPAGPLATSAVRSSGIFGVLQLTLHATSYDWQFLPIAGSAFADSGTTACHQLSAPRPAQFYSLDAPCRLADTRGAAGASGGPALLSGQARTFPVAGRCGVPAAASALAVNLTVVEATAAGNLSVFPAGGVSSVQPILQFSSRGARANNAILALGERGEIAVLLTTPTAAATAHLTLDAAGYFIE